MPVGIISSPASWLLGTVAPAEWFENVQDTLNEVYAPTSTRDNNGEKIGNVTGGTASDEVVVLGQFIRSLAASGYVQIPTLSGQLMIAWSSVAYTATPGTTTGPFTITWPLAFSAMYAVVPSLEHGNVGHMVWAHLIDKLPTSTTSTFWVGQDLDDLSGNGAGTLYAIGIGKP